MDKRGRGTKFLKKTQRPAKKWQQYSKKQKIKERCSGRQTQRETGYGEEKDLNEA